MRGPYERSLLVSHLELHDVCYTGKLQSKATVQCTVYIMSSLYYKNAS